MKVTSYIYNKLLPRTLVSRFLLIIIIPTIIAQLVAIYIFYDRHWSYIFTATSNMVVGEVRVILNIYDKYGIDLAKSEASVLGVRVRYLPGIALSISGAQDEDSLEYIAKSLEEAERKKSIVNLTNDDTEIQILLEVPGGIMEFTRSVKPLINPTTYIFIVWMVSLTFLLLIVLSLIHI